GLKHGMKLAAISGVNGPFSDADIRRVRRLALAARAKAGGHVRRPARRAGRPGSHARPGP
ncbi:MAG: dehydrogenase-like protein, partial [Proteobacteria bacterium]|nr:dehydrogenase-like protein [Pseudomonadota bacterium]